MIGGYHASSDFKARVDDAVEGVARFEQLPNTSVSLRIVYVLNAWRIYAEHPLLGVGIGDYRNEYARVNAVHTPQWNPAWNPHNQYLLTLTAAGAPGGVMLALVLLFPLLRRGPADARARIRRAVPTLLIVICLLESYLARSNVSMMYLLFTAALWCGAPQRPAAH